MKLAIKMVVLEKVNGANKYHRSLPSIAQICQIKAPKAYVG